MGGSKVRALIIFSVFSAFSSFAGELIIDSTDFDSGNLKTHKQSGTKPSEVPYVENGGESPNEAEYLIEVPEKAEYKISAFYTAQESRPVDILVNGKKVSTGFKATTGSWGIQNAKWEDQCTFTAEKGIVSIGLERQGGPIPHISQIKIAPVKALASGGSVTRAPSKARADYAQKKKTEAPKKNKANAQKAKEAPRGKESLQALVQNSPPDALVRSIKHILKTKPREYKNGRDYLKQAEDIAAKMPALLSKLDSGDPDAVKLY